MQKSTYYVGIDFWIKFCIDFDVENSIQKSMSAWQLDFCIEFCIDSTTMSCQKSDGLGMSTKESILVSIMFQGYEFIVFYKSGNGVVVVPQEMRLWNLRVKALLLQCHSIAACACRPVSLHIACNMERVPDDRNALEVAVFLIHTDWWYFANELRLSDHLKSNRRITG